MKATLEIPDELYLQVKAYAARKDKKLQDVVADALRLIIGHASTKPRRRTKSPVRISEGNTIPALSNDEMAKLAG